jgi:uncharacterized protein YecT (DUF1311 family)
VGPDAIAGSETAWLRYREKQCQAVFEFYRPGTIASAAQARCEIRLAESRMRDLNELFDGPLHH